MASRSKKKKQPVENENRPPGQAGGLGLVGEPDLEYGESTGLSDEITALRQVTRRAMELAAGTESLDETLTLMKDVSLACIRLAGLLRTQQLLVGKKDRVAESLQAAISEVFEEMQHDPK